MTRSRLSASVRTVAVALLAGGRAVAVATGLITLRGALTFGEPGPQADAGGTTGAEWTGCRPEHTRTMLAADLTYAHGGPITITAVRAVNPRYLAITGASIIESSGRD